MDQKLLKTLSSILSKIPKKDLEKNIEKAKEILKNSKKEDIQKLLSNPQISKVLGKDNESLKAQINKLNLDEINTEELEKN